MQTNIQRHYAAAIKTPKKQDQIPVPDTPTPGDMSVSFLASTPKPGCPQLSRRRPSSINPSPEKQQGTRAGKVTTLSRGRNITSPSKSPRKAGMTSPSKSPRKAGMTSPSKSPRKAGGSLEEKMASIARSRLEKKHRRASVASDSQESYSETQILNSDSEAHTGKGALETMPSNIQGRKKRKVSVSVWDEDHPRNTDQSAAYVSEQQNNNVRKNVNKSIKNNSVSQASQNKSMSNKSTQDIRSFMQGKSSNIGTTDLTRNASVRDRQRSASTDSLSVDVSHTFRKDTSALFMTRKKSVESTYDGSIVDANNNSPVKQDGESFSRNETKKLNTSKNMSKSSRIKNKSQVNNFQTASEKAITDIPKSKKISSNKTVTETPRTIKTQRVAIQNEKDQTKTLLKDGQSKRANTSKKPVDTTHAANENSRKRKMPASHNQDTTDTARNDSEKRSVDSKNVSGIRQLAVRTKRQQVVDQTDPSVNDEMPVDDDGHDTTGSSQDDHGESVKSKKKKGPIDVEVVLEMVTSNVQAHMDDCDSDQDHVALKLWKKYLTEDMTAMIKDVHNVAALQNEVKSSQHRIKQQQKHLMRIQNERMQLELDVRLAEKQAERNKDLTRINQFLSNLRHVLNMSGTKH